MIQDTLKPYLMQAFYTWGIDHQHEVLLESVSHPNNKIPKTLEGNSEIVVNISPNAVNNLVFNGEGIYCDAKINNEMHNLFLHYESISKVFVKETGYGLEFSTFEIGNEDIGGNGGKSKGKKGSHLTLVK